MQEEQEAIRFVVQIGDRALMPAKETVMYLARLVSHGLIDTSAGLVRFVGGKVGNGVDDIMSRYERMGNYGRVTYQHLMKSTRGQAREWYEIPSDALPEDYKMLNNECRKHRISFSVVDSLGPKSIVIAARDAETMKLALRKVFKSALTERELSEAETDTIHPGQGSAAEPKETINFMGQEWTHVTTPEDQPADAITYAARDSDSEGNLYVKFACSNGFWRVNQRSKDGTLLLVGEGTSDSLTGISAEGAISEANRCMGERRDQKKFKHDLSHSSPAFSERLKGLDDASKRLSEIAKRNTRSRSQRQHRSQKISERQ